MGPFQSINLWRHKDGIFKWDYGDLTRQLENLSKPKPAVAIMKAGKGAVICGRRGEALRYDGGADGQGQAAGGKGAGREADGYARMAFAPDECGRVGSLASRVQEELD